MFKKIFFANVMILFVFLVSVFILNKSVTAFREQKPVPINHCVVLDPGHGGSDVGAVGEYIVPESVFKTDSVIVTC